MSDPAASPPPGPVDVVDLAIVGAGPCGLAAAVSAGRAGLRALVFDQASVVSTITQYPTYVSFFSTAEKLSIGGLPFVIAGEKPTRRDALAYFRAVVRHFRIPVRQYEQVVEIEPLHVRRESSAPGRRFSEALSGDYLERWRELGGEAVTTTTAELPVAPPADDAATVALPPAVSSPAAPSPRRGLSSLPPRFVVHTRTRAGAERQTLTGAVVIATGYFGSPNLIRVPGEELPHVKHVYREGHEAFLQNAVVIGGGNSAAEAALDLWRSGARVTLVHFGPGFDKKIKPWVLPDFTNRAAEGSITALWNGRVREITPTHVVVQPTDGTLSGAPPEGGAPRAVPADHVYVMTGFAPNVDLLRAVGVTIDPATGIPAHDPQTLESDVPGIFIAGVVVAGYDANKVFIENGRFHGDRIVARLLGHSAPPEPQLSPELRSGDHP